MVLVSPVDFELMGREIESHLGMQGMQGYLTDMSSMISAFCGIASQNHRYQIPILSRYLWVWNEGRYAEALLRPIYWLFPNVLNRINGRKLYFLKATPPPLPHARQEEELIFGAQGKRGAAG
jgi:hypothetical protein